MKFIIGVDEVGWGAVAGPLCVGAVAVPVGWKMHGLRDSKKISPSKRDQLVRALRRGKYWPHAVAFLSPAGVDELTPGPAIKATLRAAASFVLKRCQEADLDVQEIIFDGERNFSLGVPSRAVPKADDLFPAVAMASVLAKETRDLFMRTIGKLPLYKVFDFERNAGYTGNGNHLELIKTLGPGPMHRRSYLKKHLTD